MLGVVDDLNFVGIGELDILSILLLLVWRMIPPLYFIQQFILFFKESGIFWVLFSFRLNFLNNLTRSWRWLLWLFNQPKFFWIHILELVLTLRDFSSWSVVLSELKDILRFLLGLFGVRSRLDKILWGSCLATMMRSNG